MDYGDHASEQQKPGLLRNLLSILGTILLFVAVSWVLRALVVQPYEIPSGSMEDTLQVGDRLFAEKVTYYLEEPSYGDIVTFEDPDPEHMGRSLIKRVIATGGLASLVAHLSVRIDVVDPDLTLEGLRLISEANSPR